MTAQAKRLGNLILEPSLLNELQAELSQRIQYLRSTWASLAAEGFSKGHELKGVLLQGRGHEGKINSTQSELFTDLFRGLHTLKGMALSFRFQEIGDLAGQGERLLKNSTWVKLEAKFPELILQMENALEKSIPMRMQHASHPDWEDKYHKMVHLLSQELGKRMVFELQEGLQDARQILTDAQRKALDEPLIHLIRNAADHGIEFEALRLLAGKPSAGKLVLSLKKIGETNSDSSLEIIFSDDGAGIDLSVLCAKAKEKGRISDGDLATMTEAEKLQLVFSPCLSTRDHASPISGQGMGLDIVSEWVKRHGGKIRVESAQGRGTQFIIELLENF